MLARRALCAAPAHSRAVSSIAQKYAQAAYNAALAQSPNTLKQLDQELTAISSALQSTPSLAAFVNNPTISANDRAKGLQALFAAAEGPKKTPVSTATKNLFNVLSENGRLAETSGVIEGFTALMSEYRGEATVVVTSATPLPKDIMTRLENSLKSSQAAQKAKSLKITNKVNPSVLGGIVVDFGDKTIDLSVASRVNKLNALLQESV
ncbi:SubName: Full=Probable ATP5-F1F0-ATPase complex, OSCP subunit {ECO:0000313/EMBL:CCA68522.1} [Serendipita indica DSM 11827]|uniref:ATP synthase subunit 5, mitochondrial n=1 Tax=Serendipita indica (strain DSM 11827) TaxID=1109443 RepID=G4TB13_SERID|nr:SubName: Full=Probable ATP5-F1F0-ATPase complex, OSCP subunit {ECO:0000313/EMBL:CCA68522.1} [Serendipita indica DSM 11827]CCA68522.1 probable ATP5-F1F0-ATPase complex, OSCP subunit [Serendipita indica DSM 11827]